MGWPSCTVIGGTMLTRRRRPPANVAHRVSLASTCWSGVPRPPPTNAFSVVAQKLALVHAKKGSAPACGRACCCDTYIRLIGVWKTNHLSDRWAKSRSWGGLKCRTWKWGTKKDEIPKNAGPENEGPNVTTSKCRTWKCGTTETWPEIGGQAAESDYIM